MHITITTDDGLTVTAKIDPTDDGPVLQLGGVNCNLDGQEPGRYLLVRRPPEPVRDFARRVLTHIDVEPTNANIDDLVSLVEFDQPTTDFAAVLDIAASHWHKGDYE